jgi:hypothetical protein
MDDIINKLSKMSLEEPSVKDDIDELCMGFSLISVSDKPEVNKVINEIKDTLEEEKPVQEIIKTVKNKFFEIGRILMQKERCFVPQVYSSPKWIF